MVRKREVITIGSWALILALVLRLISLAPLENEAFLSFLGYLQTGRLVRYSETPSVTVPPTTAPTPNFPTVQPSKGLQFTAADGEYVEFYDFTATNPDISALLLQRLDLVFILVTKRTYADA